MWVWVHGQRCTPVFSPRSRFGLPHLCVLLISVFVLAGASPGTRFWQVLPAPPLCPQQSIEVTRLLYHGTVPSMPPQRPPSASPPQGLIRLPRVQVCCRTGCKRVVVWFFGFMPCSSCCLLCSLVPRHYFFLSHPFACVSCLGVPCVPPPPTPGEFMCLWCVCLT